MSASVFDLFLEQTCPVEYAVLCASRERHRSAMLRFLASSDSAAAAECSDALREAELAEIRAREKFAIDFKPPAGML